MVTDASGDPSDAPAMTDGQLVIGSTGAAPTTATITAGTGIDVTNGPGSITIASTGGGADPTLTVNQVNSTTFTDTTSATDVVVTDMSINPGGGSFLVLFSGTVRNDNATGDTRVSVYKNGAQVNGSERVLQDLNNARREVSTLAHVSMLTGTIDIRWHVTAGTGRFFDRTLIVQKTAPPEPLPPLIGTDGFDFEGHGEAALTEWPTGDILWGTFMEVRVNPDEVGVDPPGAKHLMAFTGKTEIAMHRYNNGYFWSNTPGTAGNFQMHSMDICPGNYDNISYLLEAIQAGGGVIYSRVIGPLDHDAPIREDMSDFPECHRIRFTKSGTGEVQHPDAIGGAAEYYTCFTNIDMTFTPS